MAEFLIAMATHIPESQPARAENPASTAQPKWDVLATFALYGQQSLSALTRSSSRARHSPGARVAGSRTKNLNHLSSPILLDSLSDPARPRSAARHLDSHATSSPLREHQDSSSQFIVPCNPSHELRQSHLDHERDVSFSADKSRIKIRSEINARRGRCSPSDSVHRAETLWSDDRQRKQYYIEKFNMPKQKSVPTSTGSRQLRRKAGWSTETGDASPWARRSSNNFLVPQSPMFGVVDSNDFSPHERKLRLEPSTPDNEERIKQAYITTVTSPSKPQIISITRRSSSLQDTPSFQHESRPMSAPFPVTTSRTSVRDQNVRKEIGNVLEPERSHLIRCNPSEVRETPANTPFTSCRTTEFHQSDVCYESSRRSIHKTLRHQPLEWILDELDFVVANFPRIRLQLNSSVIHCIRLPNMDQMLTEWPLGNALSPSKAPHSRYSIFRPLSSHPVTSQIPQISRNTNLQKSNPAIFDPLHPDPLTDPTLCALQAIFPNAELPALECLQATYIALNYLSSACSGTLSSVAEAQFPPDLSTVPPKARAMLGLKAPTSIPRPRTSWFYPQKIELGDEGPRGRIENLVVRLRDMVDDLLEVIGERKPGVWNYEFLTAVGEVVRMGEERKTGMKGERGGRRRANV